MSYEEKQMTSVQDQAALPTHRRPGLSFVVVFALVLLVLDRRAGHARVIPARRPVLSGS
jgi:hypothetical protein